VDVTCRLAEDNAMKVMDNKMDLAVVLKENHKYMRVFAAMIVAVNYPLLICNYFYVVKVNKIFKIYVFTLFVIKQLEVNKVPAKIKLDSIFFFLPMLRTDWS
jgi:hypothetical protein